MNTNDLQHALLALALCVAAIVSTAASAGDFVVVVSVKSAIDSLTPEQVSQIFLGKTGTFPTGDQAIPIDQADGSDVRKDFYLKVTHKTVTQLAAYRANMVFSNKGLPPKEVPDSRVARKLVANNPNVISYIDKSAVDSTVKVVLAP